MNIAQRIEEEYKKVKKEEKHKRDQLSVDSAPVRK